MIRLFYIVPYWLLLFLVRQAVILAGFIVTPFALLFATEWDTHRVPKWAEWRLVRLPWWAWPWDNLHDGAMGDIYGYYWHDQAPAFLKTAYLKKLWWLAWRNPANNFSRFTPLLSVNLDGKRVALVAEGDKWALYQVEGRFYYNLQIWAFGGLFRLGHKIFPKYNGRDWSSDPLAAIKGFTFRFDKG